MLFVVCPPLTQSEQIKLQSEEKCEERKMEINAEKSYQMQSNGINLMDLWKQKTYAPTPR